MAMLVRLPELIKIELISAFIGETFYVGRPRGIDFATLIGSAKSA